MVRFLFIYKDSQGAEQLRLFPDIEDISKNVTWITSQKAGVWYKLTPMEYSEVEPSVMLAIHEGELEKLYGKLRQANKKPTTTPALLERLKKSIASQEQRVSELRRNL